MRRFISVEKPIQLILSFKSDQSVVIRYGTEEHGILTQLISHGLLVGEIKMAVLITVEYLLSTKYKIKLIKFNKNLQFSVIGQKKECNLCCHWRQYDHTLVHELIMWVRGLATMFTLRYEGYFTICGSL